MCFLRLPLSNMNVFMIWNYLVRENLKHHQNVLIWVLVTSIFSLSQCRCGPNGLLHCDWCHVGACEAGEDDRCLWSCDSDAISAKLHGADRGAVRLYLWCAAGGRFLRQHRGSSSEPLRLHPETVTDGTARTHQRNGAGV